LAARSNRKSNREALHHCGTLLAGIKIATVARQLGVSRSWASREANAAGTRILVAELLDSQGERLSELFDQTLNVIDERPAADSLSKERYRTADVAGFSSTE
jgi:hypothetical protein